MKRIMFLGLLGLLLFGCQKDNIVTIDPVMVDDTDDDISNTTFTQTVYVTFSENSNASVTGTNEDFNVVVNGNHVTVVYSGDEYVMYELTGTATDGFSKLYSSSKQALTLNGLNLTHPNGAAINVQGTMSDPSKGKHTFIVLNGENSLADGTDYSATSTGEDEKGTFFSEGQLVFSGEGSLIVKALGKSGIVSDDYVTFNGGTIHVAVTSGVYYDDEDAEYKSTAGIKANDYVKMMSGSLDITNSGTGGKGISCDGNGYFIGGTTTVTVTGSNYGSSGGGGFPGGGNNSTNSKSAKAIKFDGNLMFTGGKVVARSTAHEGIEAKGTIAISGGEIYSYSQSDDAINSGGNFTISGGHVYGHSADNDGLDANGNCYIKGGVVFAIGKSSPEVAVDANTEGGYKLYMEGGTLIAIGGLENNSSLTQSCYQASSWSQSIWYALTVGSTTYAFKTPSSGGTPLVVSGASTPTLTSNVTISGGTEYFESLFYEGATVSGGSSVSLSSYTGGNGGGGPGGGGHGPF